MGVAGRLGPSRLVRDVLPESPRVENRTGGFPAGRGMRRVAAVGPARQGVRSSSAVAPCGLRKAGQGPGRQAQGCAAQGGGRAERNRSWSVLFWSGRFRPVVLVLLSGMSRALRGMWIRAYARLPVMDAAVAIGLAFECVPDPGWLSAVVCAKPRAFAMYFCHQPARRRFCAASFVLCFVLCLCLGRMPGIQCPGSGPAGCLFYLEERRQQTIISQLSMKIKSLGRIAAKGPDSSGQCVVGLA